jgi:hypothetical protein
MTLPLTLMAFAAWQRGQVHTLSSIGRSAVHSSIRTLACPSQRTHLLPMGFASLMSMRAVYCDFLSRSALDQLPGQLDLDRIFPIHQTGSRSAPLVLPGAAKRRSEAGIENTKALSVAGA